MASAAAKLILIGEHAVVYGKPAIAIPVTSLKTSVEVSLSKTDKISTDFTLNKSLLEKSFQVIRNNYKIQGVTAKIRSNIPVGAGLGSSASLSVALTKAMNEISQISMQTKEIFRIALTSEKIFHENPSGLDITVIAHEKPVFFIKNKKTEFIKVNIRLVIADTGERSSTSKAIKVARNSINSNDCFEEIGALAIKAKAAIEERNIEKLGSLMNRNHQLLKKLNISTQRAENLVKAAIDNNALGAKLSGAGLGGVVVALCNESATPGIMKAMYRQGALKVYQAKIVT